MKKVVLLLVLLVFLIFPKSVFAGELGGDSEYAGYLKTEVWIKNNTNNNHQHLSSFKNTFDLAIEYNLSDAWAFFFHPRYFYDHAYGIRAHPDFDKAQYRMAHTERTEWLRDFYLDYTSDQLDIRLGKQQVAWSQADGLPFLLDRVMPFDLSYFWLPDFADIRIPLWMIKAEYSPRTDSTLQFLLIPDFEASRSAPAYAPFAFKANNDFKTALPNAGTGLIRPGKKFKNSRVGLRWRSFISDWEYTLNWLYGHTPGAFTYTTRAGVSYTREHKIIHVMGSSFNRSFTEAGPLEGLTLRGEFAYIHDEPTYYGTNAGSRQGTEPSDKYAWFLGFDRNFFTNWMFSLQLYQYITNNRTWETHQILNGYTYGLMDKIENGLTCKIATDFMHERLKPEVLVIYGDDNDGRIALKTKYELRDNLWLGCGYYHFWGGVWGTNGQYRNNDHAFFDVTYTF